MGVSRGAVQQVRDNLSRLDPRARRSDGHRAVGDGPWPGPVAYREGDHRPFVGRRSDADTLVSLIRTYGFVLLHAPSGAGKSSLVNAAVIPRLRSAGYKIIGPGRVLPRQVHSESRPNPYTDAFLHSIGVDPARYDGLDGFVGYLTRESSSITDTGALQPTLVVFDQFEEVLSLCDNYAGQQRQLMRSVGEAALVRDNLKALFLVRDDHLGPIMRLGRSLPTDGFPARMHLDSILTEDAPQLLIEPAGEFGVTLTDDVVHNIVRGAAQERYAIETENGRYQSYETTSENVGLVTLQVAARSLWESAHGASIIDATHLAAIGDVAGALGSYYDKSVQEAAAASSTSEATIRDLFELELISTNDQRQLVPALEARDAVGNAALGVLEERAVVRKLTHGPGYFELCHDSFIRPVRVSNQAVRRADRGRRSRLNRIVVGILLAFFALVAIGAITEWWEGRDIGIAVGEAKSGTISEVAEIDAFTVELDAGQTIRVRVDPADSLSPLLGVDDPDGERIASDQVRETRQKWLVFRSAHDGVHRINVSGVGESTGGYDITLDAFSPIPLEIGQPAMGTLAEGEGDAYEFSPDDVTLASIRLSTDDDVDGHVELTNAVGTTIIDMSWTDTDEVLLAELVGGGPFRILVRGLDGGPGAYTLAVDAAEPQQISADATVTQFSIADVDRVEIFEISGGASDELIAVTVDSPLDIASMIWAPGSEALTWLSSIRNSGSDEQVFVSNLAADVDHLVAVWTMSDATGSGEIEVRSLDTGDTPPVSETASGSIETAGEIDAYSLAADADFGTIATVLTPSSDFDAMLYSGSATGGLVRSDGPGDGGTEIVVSGAEISGVQTVAVAGFEGDTGEYDVFTMTVDALPIDIDDRVVVARSGDRFDVATFTGAEGQLIDIDAAGQEIILVHPTGGTLVPNDDGTYPLHLSAQYYVFVNTSDGQTADYELLITELPTS